MVEISWGMISTAVNRHFRNADVDRESMDALAESEEKVDEMQMNITNYLVEITRRSLTPAQSHLIPLLMHCTNDAERIADHTETILRLTKRLNKANARLSDVALQDLDQLWLLLDTQAENVRLALSSASVDRKQMETMHEEGKKLNKLTKKYEKSITSGEAVPVLTLNQDDAAPGQATARNAKNNEEQINALTEQYEQEHVARRKAGQCAVDANVIFIEMLWELEQVGDRLANIAQRAPAIQRHYIGRSS